MFCKLKVVVDILRIVVYLLLSGPFGNNTDSFKIIDNVFDVTKESKHFYSL